MREVGMGQEKSKARTRLQRPVSVWLHKEALKYQMPCLLFALKLGWSWFSCQVVFDSLWPTGHGPPRSSVHEICQARILEWVSSVPFPSQGGLPNPGTEPNLLVGRWTVYHSATGKLGRGWFSHTWLSPPGGLGVVLVSRTKKPPEGGSCGPLAASTHTNSESVAPDGKGIQATRHQRSPWQASSCLPWKHLLSP